MWWVTYDSLVILDNNHQFNSSGEPKTFLAKYNSNGLVLWAKSIADMAYGFNACIDDCDNVWVSGGCFFDINGFHFSNVIDGHTIPLPTGFKDPMFIGNWKSDGSFVTASILPTGGDDLNTVAIGADKNFYICGDFYGGPFTIGSTVLPHDSALGVLEDMYIAKFLPNNCTPSYIPEQARLWNISIFPNPAHEQFTISYPSDLNENVEVQLCNMLGQLVYTTRLTTNNTIISTSSLNAGMYVCKIIVQGQGIITKKIQVEK